MQSHLRHGRRALTPLTQYSQSVGRLAELWATHAALVAAKQEAEQEAASVHLARNGLERANAALREEMTARQQTQSRLAYLASHDPLTALPNRVSFNAMLSREMEAALQQGHKLALLYLDLDHFKDVNDTLGHAVGDVLLQHVSTRLQNTLRSGETLARLGGDEFAVMQATVPGAWEANSLGERIVSVLEKAFTINGRSIFIGVSVGITLFPDDALEIEPLHRNADLAMYRAKNSGRNRCQVFDEALNDEVCRRTSLEQAMREPALLSQLSLLFQPQVDLRSQRVTGMEALVRWNHPLLGSIAPDEFIPLAERSGAIIPIGDWVMIESCRQAARWREAGVPPFTVAVNVAAAQFRSGNIPRLVMDVLAETGLPASCLELEITETGIMHDVKDAAATLKVLSKRGVRLAIDDFGTGYSSLSYLRQLPVDRIKIDKSFVQNVHDNADAREMVAMIASLAQNLRMGVVAEGVETRPQAELVRDLGCAYAQGYYFGRPAAGLLPAGFIGGTVPWDAAPPSWRDASAPQAKRMECLP